MIMAFLVIDDHIHTMTNGEGEDRDIYNIIIYSIRGVHFTPQNLLTFVFIYIISRDIDT